MMNLSNRFRENFRENRKGLIALLKDQHDERDELLRYYRWHFKELLLCVVLALLLTRVDKVQQFFSAFAIEVTRTNFSLTHFAFSYFFNGLIIWWLCYVYWHKPGKVGSPRWRRWLFGYKSREDFEDYYHKPGSAWRVAMVSCLPLLLATGAVSMALLRGNPFDDNPPSNMSRLLDANPMICLLVLTLLYLLMGSLIRPRPNIYHGDREPCSLLTYQRLLNRLTGVFWTNIILVVGFAVAFAGGMCLFRSWPLSAQVLYLMAFTLAPTLAAAFVFNTASECLILESQREDEHVQRKKKRKKADEGEGAGIVENEKPYRSPFKVGYKWLMRASYATSFVLFVWCNNSDWTQCKFFSEVFFPVAMLIFVFIAYYQVLDLLSYNMTALRFNLLVGALLGVTIFFGQREHYRLKFRGEGGSVTPLPLEQYFLEWTKSRFDQDTATTTFYLAAAEGGGSRSGAWTTAVLTELNRKTQGRFQQQLFAVSAVSGGSVGTAATLALWDNAAMPGVPTAQMFDSLRHRAYLEQIFNRNYISSALAGIFFYDVWQQVPGIHFAYPSRQSRTDRHQNDENDAVRLGLLEVFGPQKYIDPNYLMNTNFLSLYYDVKFERNASLRVRPGLPLPLFFPNTCRVEDGRRGIVSAVQVDTSNVKINPKNPFNASVVDIVGITCDQKPTQALSLGEATSLSELFPVVNSTVFIDENTGSFMDGGVYENLGLSTLYEIHAALKNILHDKPNSSWLQAAFPDTVNRRRFEAFFKKVHFKTLLIYNSDNHGNEQRAGYDDRTVQIFDPFTALMQTPFGGHTDYMYHKVKSEWRTEGVIDFPLLTNKELTKDYEQGQYAEKIVMSRWLSRFELDAILVRAAQRVREKIDEMK